MAIGTYTLPICDLCKLPWLPTSWQQDSDPRARDGKPLRCGKCKTIGWDREFVKQQKVEAVETIVNSLNATETIELSHAVVLNDVSTAPRVRCKHRMADCPICHPKGAA